jgi:hypothetical protein
MEPEISLLQSQEHTTSLYSKTEEPSSYHIFFLHLRLVLPSSLFSSGSPTITLY